MPDLYPVLSIVGTTATGKTKLALAVATQLLAEKKRTGVDIISADSRQVFKGLEILSGADIPEGFEAQKDLSVSAFRFFQKGEIRLFGISIVNPDEDWSVAQFQEYALPIIEAARQEQRAIIVVGGTGLYHEHLFNPDPTLQIPPNEEFRALAQTMSTAELQQLLQQLNSEKFENMNNSDRNNPRRLVRAIEVAQFGGGDAAPAAPTNYTQKYIGLTASLDFITEKINLRIVQRLAAGVLEEVKNLQDTHGDCLCEQVKTTLGFEQITKLSEGTISQEQAVAEWQTAEKQYAQRQLTWWKAKDFVNFFEVDQQQDALVQALKFASD